MEFEIVPFDNLTHREKVISLWREVFGYETAHNSPDLVIDQKVDFNDGLFFVAAGSGDVLGTVMAGFDGHRGWIYSLAVLPPHRNKGLGSALLSFAEKRLLQRGCVKINLQILEDNESVEAFYISNGYSTERRISMGKRLFQE